MEVCRVKKTRPSPQPSADKWRITPSLGVWATCSKYLITREGARIQIILNSTRWSRWFMTSSGYGSQNRQAHLTPERIKKVLFHTGSGCLFNPHADLGLYGLSTFISPLSIQKHLHKTHTTHSANSNKSHKKQNNSLRAKRTKQTMAAGTQLQIYPRGYSKMNHLGVLSWLNIGTKGVDFSKEGVSQTS